MKIKTHLVISKNGNVKMLKNCPSLRINEVSMLLEINIPDAVFIKPSLSATINITGEDVDKHLSADVHGSIKEAIQQSTGLEVTLIEKQD